MENQEKAPSSEAQFPEVDLRELFAVLWGERFELRRAFFFLR